MLQFLLMTLPPVLMISVLVFLERDVDEPAQKTEPRGRKRRRTS